MKPGGHFSISDIMLIGNLPLGILETAELYAGCVSGAILKEQYLEIVKSAGFVNINVQKEKHITLPDVILKKYLSDDEMKIYKQSNADIFSIAVYGEKPKDECCDKKICCN